jgi:transposase
VSLKKTLKEKRSAKHIAVDDFAFKKRKSYGTAVIDADTGEYLAFLKSRDYDDLIPFLREFNGVETVSRDGSQTYANTIAAALPNAEQVSDRFHLIKNLTEAASGCFERIIPFCIAERRKNENALGIIGKMTAVERGILVNYDKKLRQFKKIKALQRQGKTPATVSCILGLSDDTVRKYFKLDKLPPKKDALSAGASKLNAYKPQIVEMIKKGFRGIDIIAAVRQADCTSADSRIKWYISKIRRDGAEYFNEKFYRRDVCRLLYNPPEKIRDETLREKVVTYAASHAEVETVISLVNEFRIILKSAQPDLIDDWNAYVKNLNIRELNGFVKHLESDLIAVKNAVRYLYSNGVAEGKINKIKTIKRQTYGRASYELLTSRLFLSDMFG